jgi:hypothetical protein
MRYNLLEDGDFAMSTAPTGMSGNAAMTHPSDDSSTISGGFDDCGGCEEEDITEEELRLAKRYIDIMGSPERAQEALQRVLECEDCLGILDDDQGRESEIIGAIAAATPDDVDMPAEIPVDVSKIYDVSKLRR